MNRANQRKKPAHEFFSWLAVGSGARGLVVTHHGPPPRVYMKQIDASKAQLEERVVLNHHLRAT